MQMTVQLGRPHRSPYGKGKFHLKSELLSSQSLGWATGLGQGPEMRDREILPFLNSVLFQSSLHYNSTQKP